MLRCRGGAGELSPACGSPAAATFPPHAAPRGPKQGETTKTASWGKAVVNKAATDSPASPIPTRCRGPALPRTPSQGQIKTGVKMKTSGHLDPAREPWVKKGSLESPWCPGESLALASPARHLSLAQSRTKL